MNKQQMLNFYDKIVTILVICLSIIAFVSLVFAIKFTPSNFCTSTICNVIYQSSDTTTVNVEWFNITYTFNVSINKDTFQCYVCNDVVELKQNDNAYIASSVVFLFSISLLSLTFICAIIRYLAEKYIDDDKENNFEPLLQSNKLPISENSIQYEKMSMPVDSVKYGKSSIIMDI